MSNKKLIVEKLHKKIYREGNLFIKEFDETYDNSDVLNEALNDSRVDDIGLNVPNIESVFKDKGKWYIVTDFIEGDILSDLMVNDKNNFDKYLKDFVDLQLKIFNSKCPLLIHMKDKFKQKLDETSYEATTRMELTARLSLTGKDLRICHGDFVPSNIIRTKDGNYTIIDWAHVSLGPQDADVVNTYLSLNLKGEEEFAKLYIDEYLNRTGKTKKDLEAWFPIVAAIKTLKCKENQKEYLDKFVRGIYG